MSEKNTLEIFKLAEQKAIEILESHMVLSDEKLLKLRQEYGSDERIVEILAMEFFEKVVFEYYGFERKE